MMDDRGRCCEERGVGVAMEVLLRETRSGEREGCDRARNE